jgi:hypothetical protein
MASSVAPPGWPSDLPPPGTAAFAERVSGWLLDRCAPEVRSARAVRRYPVALAHVAVAHLEALVAGQREAYRSARRDLTDTLPPDALAAVLADLEAIGHTAVGQLREVRLVADALQGTVWREKL